VYNGISYTREVKQFTSVNKFVSGGIEQVLIIQQTNIFPRFFHQSFGCILHRCTYFIHIFTANCV